jgi:hypothetical protein
LPLVVVGIDPGGTRTRSATFRPCDFEIAAVTSLVFDDAELVRRLLVGITALLEFDNGPARALEPAATVAGFALSPFSAAAVPEITTAITHLRDVLGDQTYESLARKGETMTTAAMVTYAYDQIDQTRAELNAVSK